MSYTFGGDMYAPVVQPDDAYVGDGYNKNVNTEFEVTSVPCSVKPAQDREIPAGSPDGVRNAQAYETLPQFPGAQFGTVGTVMCGGSMHNGINPNGMTGGMLSVDGQQQFFVPLEAGYGQCVMPPTEDAIAAKQLEAQKAEFRKEQERCQMAAQMLRSERKHTEAAFNEYKIAKANAEKAKAEAEIAQANAEIAKKRAGKLPRREQKRRAYVQKQQLQFQQAWAQDVIPKHAQLAPAQPTPQQIARSKASANYQKRGMYNRFPNNVPSSANRAVKPVVVPKPNGSLYAPNIAAQVQQRGHEKIVDLFSASEDESPLTDRMTDVQKARAAAK